MYLKKPAGMTEAAKFEGVRREKALVLVTVLRVCAVLWRQTFRSGKRAQQ
ncbi:MULTISPECIES: hypothetical protein [unclassified Bradyrhizobium]|nr:MULTISPECIES: hypothetical protein [unclassified Bradyrhizobium]MBR1228792.1 hypothetical protein [Bradyrhizobium sp. AUGA SZCCT0176]MBR1299719.1 hypothetical protein [Bradyrhizobium sp. AUGA SZCCT0042]